MRRPPYKVMASSEIAALPVQSLANDNCILFVWTTDYHLDKCLGIIKSWGFEYKTIGFAWQKLNKKNQPVCFMGAYTMKSGIELCLLATKGKDAAKMVKSHKVRALVQSQREHHSKKPDIIRDKIVDLCGDVPRIELFARNATPGWDIWGNEVESSINL